jgi:multiple sugar transport system substrate-binding protein
MKRFFCSLIAIVLLVGFTVSCGKEAKDKEVNISYMIWDRNQEPGMRAIADRFEELNPGIKVKVEVLNWGDYWTKLEAAATGENLPDLFWMHATQFYKYANAGMLMELGDKVAADSEIDYSNYQEGLAKLYELDGKNYAIPKDIDTIGLWYNKTLFDKAGLSYPDETWTWDDLLEAAKKLTDTKNKVYGFAAPVNRQEGIDNLIYQNGGFVLSEDKKQSGYGKSEAQEAIQKWVDFSTKYKVSPTAEQFSETGPYEMLSSGRVAMMLLGSWMVAPNAENDYIRENCDIAVLPKMKKRASIANGLGNVVAATTKHPEAAWKFAKYMGSEEANLIQAKYASAIPAYKGTVEPWVEATSKNFNTQAYVDELAYSVPFATSKTSDKWSQLFDEIMPAIFTGEKTVKEGTTEFADKMNALLATE